MASRPMGQDNHRGAPSQQQQPESTSVIDQYSNFDGTYNSARDLRVEGKVTGTIVCKGTLHVAQGATVNASIEAEAISVAGELEGEITCRGRLELLPSGRAKGQISTQSLIIHEGAVYEGDLEMGATAGRPRRNRAQERDLTEATSSLAAAVGADASADEGAPTADEPVENESGSTAARPNSFIRRFGTPESQTTSLSPEAMDE